MTVVSIDLAYRDYRDFGIAILDDGSSGATFELLSSTKLSNRAPTPEHVADFIIELCNGVGASLVLLDGPQGWKDPSNGLTHSRRCERTLNTPAKTGLPGNVKPANYFAFVDFAVRVFDALHVRDWKRFDPATWCPGHPAVVESFPLSAWRALRLQALPAKSKARDVHIRRHFELLIGGGLITGNGLTPTHDELQALVAGLGGLGLIASDPHRHEVVGTAPFDLDGAWREGYIINPKSDREH
ncbi:MAG: hypothetical protein ACLPKB_02135 [Xanthobacteraceae bacterium]